MSGSTQSNGSETLAEGSIPTGINRRASRLRSRAWWVAAAYFVFAILWIYFSDRAIGVLISDPAVLVKWSVYKGFGFVLVTSILLGFLMRRVFGAIESGFVSLKAKEKQLRASEEQLSAIIRSAMDAIVTVDHTQRIVLFNVAAERMFRCREAEALGQPIERFIPGCFDLIEGKKHAIVGRRMNEEEFPLEASLSRINPGDQKLLTVILRDLTQRKIREEKQQQAEAVARAEKRFSDTMIESMPGILYFYDAKGQFLRWNRNFEIVSGYSREEIARMSASDFFKEADKTLLAEKIAEVFDKGESSLEAPFLARNGTSTPYFFTGRRVVLGETVCLVGVGIDISERKRAEMALRVLNQTLELEVSLRTEELNSALSRAEAADRIKSAFLATMSHELRTPLNSIIGFTGIILQGLAGPLNPEQTKQLGMVRSSSRHLLELINDILDLSKIEAGQLEIRASSFNLRDSLERVSTLLKPLAEKKNLTLSLIIPPDLSDMVSDRRRVEQVLINLINNAIKFTEQGGVTVTAEMVSNDQLRSGARPCPAVRIRVADTGIGIKPEDMETLFQPFRQLDTGLSRQHEGTGLGLAICLRVATLLGGDISTKSKWSEGSEFTVTLPLHHPGQL